MTITQERNSPAYLAFRETQRLNQIVVKTKDDAVPSIGSTHQTVSLSTETINPLVGSVSPKSIEQKNMEPMAFTRVELQKVTDEKIQQMLAAQKNSTLLGAFIEQPTAFAKNETKKTNTAQAGIVIQGSFELREGVGILDHIVTLTRILDGQTLELGQVDLKAGLYQIIVNSFEGELHAEIKDHNGALIGEDRRELVGLKQAGAIFQGPSLKLGKPSSLAFNPRSADENRKRDNDTGMVASFFSGNYDLENPKDDYPNVSRQSSTVGFLHDPKQKIINTLSLRAAQDNTETVLFSKLWVEGAVSYAAQKLQLQFSQDTGVLVGRVVDDGRPIENVRVVIDDQPGVEIFYLDDFWIPQNDRQGTSKNGYFFIPGLTKGSYQISAFENSFNKNKGSQLFVVDVNALSYQEITYQKIPSMMSLYSYDAFTSQPMSSDLILPGIEDVVSIDEDGQVKYRVNFKSGIQEMMNRPLNRDYVTYTTVRSGNENFNYFPQVQESWLKAISEKAKIEVDLEKNVYIAFTATPEFSITMADASYDSRNVVYFKSTGEIATGPSVGGGAVFFNVKEGLQEVVLSENSSQKVHSSVFYAKSNRIFVSVYK
jgi:hypothetical protein